MIIITVNNYDIIRTYRFWKNIYQTLNKMKSNFLKLLSDFLLFDRIYFAIKQKYIRSKHN